MASSIQPDPSQNPNYPQLQFEYLFRKLLAKTDMDWGFRFPQDSNFYLLNNLPDSIKNKAQTKFGFEVRVHTPSASFDDAILRYYSNIAGSFFRLRHFNSIAEQNGFELGNYLHFWWAYKPATGVEKEELHFLIEKVIKIVHNFFLYLNRN